MEIFLGFVKAFLVGGLFCVAAQLLIDFTKLTPARILVLYVTIGVFLGAVGIYGVIAEFAGAGATSPLTGFGWNISKGVKRAVDDCGFIGIFTGALTAAAGGTSAALVFGFLASLIFKGKPKK